MLKNVNAKDTRRIGMTDELLVAADYADTRIGVRLGVVHDLLDPVQVNICTKNSIDRTIGFIERYGVRDHRSLRRHGVKIRQAPIAVAQFVGINPVAIRLQVAEIIIRAAYLVCQNLLSLELTIDGRRIVTALIREILIAIEQCHSRDICVMIDQSLQ